LEGAISIDYTIRTLRLEVDTSMQHWGFFVTLLCWLINVSMWDIF